MRDEGVIKFHCEWINAPIPEVGLHWSELIAYRNKLYADGLIGVYPDGIGFGNISLRWGASEEFVISASQTGHIPVASADHFALVTKYDVEQNSIICVGPMKASSESLTHAMIYATFSEVTAVIHVHNNSNWHKLLQQIPTSRPEVPYGTPEMAAEVQRLAREEDLGHKKIFVMAGHEDGILSLGTSLEEAYQVMYAHLELSRL